MIIKKNFQRALKAADMFCEKNPLLINREALEKFVKTWYVFASKKTCFVKKERSKVRHLKKFVKPMDVKLRSKVSH